MRISLLSAMSDEIQNRFLTRNHAAGRPRRRGKSVLRALLAVVVFLAGLGAHSWADIEVCDTHRERRCTVVHCMHFKSEG